MAPVWPALKRAAACRRATRSAATRIDARGFRRGIETEPHEHRPAQRLARVRVVPFVRYALEAGRGIRADVGEVLSRPLDRFVDDRSDEVVAVAGQLVPVAAAAVDEDRVAGDVVRRLLDRFRDDHRQRIAHVTHAITDERRPRRRGRGGAVAPLARAVDDRRAAPLLGCHGIDHFGLAPELALAAPRVERGRHRSAGQLVDEAGEPAQALRIRKGIASLPLRRVAMGPLDDASSDALLSALIEPSGRRLQPPERRAILRAAAGNPLAQKWATRALETVGAIAKIKAGPEVLHSTLGRHAARAIRAAMLADLGADVVVAELLQGLGYRLFTFVGTGTVLAWGVVAALLIGAPRICGVWGDLDPAAGGIIAAGPQGSNYVIRFLNVPEFYFGGLNTFTITLRPDASFRVDYGVTDALLSAVAGRSPGGGASDPDTTDLSTAPQPLGQNAETVYEEFFLGIDLANLHLEYAPCGSQVGVPDGGVVFHHQDECHAAPPTWACRWRPRVLRHPNA